MLIAVLINEFPEVLVSAWRFKFGTCVPAGFGGGAAVEPWTNSTCKGSAQPQPWTDGWCGYSTSWPADWNSSELECVERQWRWRHPSDPERVCFDGVSSSNCICIHQICYADASGETYRGDVSTGLQDLLVCIEMFIASLAHAWCFTYKAHRDRSGKHHKSSTKKALVEMANWSDVGENGLLGVKQMLHDSKAFAQGMKRGLLNPEELEYYWPQARVLSDELMVQLRERINEEVQRREHKNLLARVPILLVSVGRAACTSPLHHSLICIG